MEKDKVTAQTIIKCPHCGYEYLPGEIFMPGEVIGQPKQVIRDALGKIIYVDYKEGEEPDQTETFVCEHCNKQFVVESSSTYKSQKEVEELDFTNKYVSLID